MNISSLLDRKSFNVSGGLNCSKAKISVVGISHPCGGPSALISHTHDPSAEGFRLRDFRIFQQTHASSETPTTATQIINPISWPLLVWGVDDENVVSDVEGGPNVLTRELSVYVVFGGSRNGDSEEMGGREVVVLVVVLVVGALVLVLEVVVLDDVVLV